jgi:hypothetical protein
MQLRLHSVQATASHPDDKNLIVLVARVPAHSTRVCFFLFLNNVMPAFQPDWDYLIDQIADAYVSVQQALDQDDFDQARFWEHQLSLLTRHLDLWIRESK